MLVDTHTHLYSDVFDKDIEKVVENAIQSGVGKFFLPAINSQTHEKMLSLEARYPHHMFAMMGLHPTDVKPDSYMSELEIVKKYVDSRDFCAIGEIGIDLYWDKTTLEIQQEAFALQIDWAREKGLPIVIHCRDAFDEVFEILETKRSKDLYGIFHCFTGTKEQGERAIDLGMKLGIGGVVTFKNGKIDQFLKEIDLENIVLETDSPYLAPTPFRGKRNESKMLVHIAEKLSDIYGMSIEKIAEITTKNALDVFGKE